jgi:adenylosuccinate lyase
VRLGQLTEIAEVFESAGEAQVRSGPRRICLPDAAAAVEHILSQTAALVAGLTVDADRMALNLSAAGTASQTQRAVVVLCDHGVPISPPTR